VATHVALLRGINIGSRNRVSMPKLRDALEAAGFDKVETYLQSGNVVLSSPKKADDVRRECERLIAKELGLDVEVVVRSRGQLAAVVKRNPLGKVAKNPKRYQVSFLATRPSAAVVTKVATSRNWTTVTKLLELADQVS
jgi:uncharacterized protein (DUF1697 family)